MSTKVLPTAYLLSSLFILVLFAFRFSNSPTSYLHSWNQITTLATIEQLHHGFFVPKEVVIHASTAEQAKSVESAFVNIEEFPLYHLLATTVLSLFSLSAEQAGHLTSILFWLLFIQSAYRLAQNHGANTSPLIIVYLLLWSSPLLYYGQAIMSDMAMTACGTVSLLRQQQKQKRIALLWAIAASLMKSYGVLFIAAYFLAEKGAWFKKISLFILCLLPLLAWHGYGLLLPGESELFRQLSWNKISALAFLPLSIPRALLRLLGVVPVVLALYLFWVKKGFRATIFLPHYCCCLMIYLCLVPEKLFDHDYYFLPLLLPATLFLGQFFVSAPRWLILCLIFGTPLKPVHNFLRATAENPDVKECAQLLTNQTSTVPVLLLTDVSRFNSLAFYGQVQGIFVTEEDLKRPTVQSFADLLLINLSPEVLVDPQAPWSLITKVESKDARGEIRVCQLFKKTQ